MFFLTFPKRITNGIVGDFSWDCTRRDSRNPSQMLMFELQFWCQFFLYSKYFIFPLNVKKYFFNLCVKKIDFIKPGAMIMIMTIIVLSLTFVSVLTPVLTDPLLFLVLFSSLS